MLSGQNKEKERKSNFHYNLWPMIWLCLPLEHHLTPSLSVLQLHCPSFKHFSHMPLPSAQNAPLSISSPTSLWSRLVYRFGYCSKTMAHSQVSSMRSFIKMWALLREASQTSCSKASLPSNSRKPYHLSVTGVRDEVGVPGTSTNSCGLQQRNEVNLYWKGGGVNSLISLCSYSLTSC